MFKVRVIPCLDVKDGRVVKGVKFRDVRAAGDLVEAAISIGWRARICEWSRFVSWQAGFQVLQFRTIQGQP
jgi:hypothetical protein